MPLPANFGRMVRDVDWPAVDGGAMPSMSFTVLLSMPSASDNAGVAAAFLRVAVDACFFAKAGGSS